MDPGQHRRAVAIGKARILDRNLQRRRGQLRHIFPPLRRRCDKVAQIPNIEYLLKDIAHMAQHLE